MSIDFPNANQRTVCELNCRLVHVDADSRASTPGLSYPSVRLQQTVPPELQTLQAPAYFKDDAGGHTLSNDDMATPSRSHRSVAASLSQVLAAPLAFLSRLLSGPSHSSTSAPPPACWHPHKSLLAVPDTLDRVHVYDMSGAEASGSNGSRTAPPLAESATVVLAHDLQHEVCSLAWRPNGGGMLAVGCRGGVALWSTSGTMRPPLAGRAGARSAGPWLSVLKAHSPAVRICCLAWSPDGRLLVGASPDFPGLCLWDVSLGTCVRVGASLVRHKQLAWSPDGNYVFAGSAAGACLYLYETTRWLSQSWEYSPPPPGGLAMPLSRQQAPAAPGPGEGTGGAAARGLINAYWAPNSRVLLAAFAGATHMVALHLVGEPPSLTAQLMPVTLQDMAVTGPADQGAAGGAGLLTDLSWDPRGERLAVLLGPPHPAAGCLAVYATTYDPVVHARLLGYARPGRPDGAVDPASLQPGALSPHMSFARGALFSLRLSETEVYNLPLCYRQ